MLSRLVLNLWAQMMSEAQLPEEVGHTVCITMRRGPCSSAARPGGTLSPLHLPPLVLAVSQVFPKFFTMTRLS